MTYFCDTHCHLYMDAYAQDLDQVLEDARNHNVQRIVVPGVNLESSRQAIALAEKYECLYAAVGVHPHDAQYWQPGWKQEFIAMAKHPKVVAIGEIGLDYYRNFSPQAIQLHVYQQQLDIALESQKPVIFHERESAADMWKLIKARAAEFTETFQNNWGVLHSFSSTLQYALMALEYRLYLGISGPVTYKNAFEKQHIIDQMPLDAMLLETDGPYLPPHPHRGQRNEPQFIPIIAEKIAQLKQCSIDQVCEITTSNTNSLFFWRSNC
jgi:TatD DNase family protein